MAGDGLLGTFSIRNNSQLQRSLHPPAVKHIPFSRSGRLIRAINPCLNPWLVAALGWKWLLSGDIMALPVLL